MLERHASEVTLGTALRTETWSSVVRQLDLALAGGSETTAVGAAMIGDEAVIFAPGVHGRTSSRSTTRRGL